MGALMASGLPAITAQAPAVAAETKKKFDKQGLASMLSGIGKGKVDENFGLRPLPQQQPVDLQGLLASLFGGG